MVVAVGCALLPELDSFAWEQSYSKSHQHGKATFISALFDSSAEEDADGDGAIKLWQGAFAPVDVTSFSCISSQQNEKVESPSFTFPEQKYFLLHRRLLL